MNALTIAVCSLALSFGAAVGLNIQKLSMNKETRKEPHHRRPPFLQPLWCLGMTIIILDAIGDFVFIGLAPQSLLAPLGSLNLGWNMILAPFFNPEEIVTRQIVGATAVIYLGTIFTVLHATKSAPTYNLQDILGFVTNHLFIIYFSFSFIFQGILNVDGRKKGYGLIHYCSLAGCYGGFSILFAKSSSELIKYALLEKTYDDWTTSILPYCFLLGMIVSVLAQIHFLNTGLSRFDALLVLPVYRSFWNAFGITGGLIFFQEYQNMKVYDIGMYLLGTGITLSGVMLLVRQRKIESLPTKVV